MEVKVGDLIKDRFVIKQIMLDPKKDFQEPVFFLYDKEENKVVEYDKKQMMGLLEIKEVE